MPTLPIRASRLSPLWWPRLRFARIVSFVEDVRDLLTEVDRQAGAARERYPLAD
jgi:hypothetical protein